ncbi:hypothetical protein OPT61_g5804 [Boeremia exigua]|uniref:Uncharacterized protein n=1 Tax=Boeremia exigua TaxID=749465 RepID=A0ACC2I925_9PLEO|nr:hypothetical protein OPT61_g5804 [Boeremia exigua]
MRRKSSVVAYDTIFVCIASYAWVEKARLVLCGCGGGIIAWKGSNTIFPNKYGCYVAYSTREAANSTTAAKNVGKYSLGRSWDSLHRSAYVNSTMNTTILPQGYTKWSNNPAKANYGNFTLMAEYASQGPGWDITVRAADNVTLVLNGTVVSPYSSPAHVFMTAEGRQPHVL